MPDSSISKRSGDSDAWERPHPSRSQAETPTSRGTLPLRLAREYIYQLEHACEGERLDRALTTIPVFVTLYRGGSRYEVLRHWAGSDQETTGTAYRKKLADWRARRQPDAEELDDVLTILTTLLTDIGRWQDAMALCNERVEIACSTGNRAREAWALETLGWLEYLRGEYAESEKHVREAESIARELKIPQLVATAVGRRGLVLYSLGEYDGAMACYAEQESIARELGDRRNIAIAIGNRGIIHRNRREYDEAVACYRQQEEIAREIGDRQSIAIAIGNRGNVHWKRGKYAEALECFQRAGEEHRAIGFGYGLSYWLEGTANVLLSLVASAEAMPEYLAKHLPGITDQTWRTVSLQHARSCADECLAISRELSKPDTLATSQELLARIDELTASG